MSFRWVNDQGHSLQLGGCTVTLGSCAVLCPEHLPEVSLLLLMPLWPQDCRFQGARVLGCQGTKVLGYQGARISGYWRVAMLGYVPRVWGYRGAHLGCQDSRVLGYQDAKIPGCAAGER